MFRPLARDRRAWLAVLGLLVCSAYVVGGLAVATGLEDAAVAKAGGRLPPGRLAWPGQDPLAVTNATVPEDPVLDVYRVAYANLSVGRVVVATVVRGPPLPEAGLAPAHLVRALGPVEVDGVTLPVGEPPLGMPVTWVWLNTSSFATRAPEGGGVVAFAPRGLEDHLPPTWTAVDASGFATFGSEGLADAGRAILLLAFATSVVVLLLAKNFLSVAVAARADDLLLLHALGASRRRIELRVLGWTLRLSALGLVLGVGAGLGLAHLGGSLAALVNVPVSLSPRLDPERLLLVLGVLLAAAGIGAYFGARRSVARLFGDAPPESRVTVTISIALVLAIFVGTHLVVASALSADWLYAGEVVARGGSPIPTHSELPASFAEDLVVSGAARDAVPQIVAFTAVDGRPATVRGAEAALLVPHHRGIWREGRAPAAFDEASVGAGLAERHDVAIGDVLVLSASHRAGAQPVVVVGIFEAPGLLRDEVVVPLPVGRLLAGLDAKVVHVIEVTPRDPALLHDFVGSLGLPPLRILVPQNMTAGSVEVRGRDGGGLPVPHARITANNETVVADAQGRAVLPLPAGAFRVVVRAEGYRVAVVLLEVPAPPPKPGEERLVIFPADPPKPRAPPQPGGGGGDGGGNGTDGGAAPPPDPPLSPDDSGFREVTQIEGPEESRLGRVDSDDPLARVFGNLLAAILGVVLLSTLLLTAGIGSIYGRHVYERREDVVLLRQLGATSRQLRGIFAGRVLMDGSLAVLGGAVLGVYVAHAYASVAPLVVFGHAVPFAIRAEPILVVAPLALAALGAAAYLAARSAARDRLAT